MSKKLQESIPVIFCSSKTRVEQEVYRHGLGVFHPFVVENGGAIFIPEGYFPFKFDYHGTKDGYQIIELGIAYHEVRRILERIRADAKINFRGFDVMGSNDKGKATKILINLFRKKLGRLKTVGIGDSPNDLPMLLAVDIPVLVQKPEGVWEEMDIPNLGRVEGVGPEGWARAVEEIMQVHN